MYHISRRKFVEATAAAAAVAGVSVAFFKPSLLVKTFPQATSSPTSLQNNGSANSPIYDTSLYTACHACDQQCAEIAYLKNNVLVKLDGNPANPQCAGRLCPKGQAALADLYIRLPQGPC